VICAGIALSGIAHLLPRNQCVPDMYNIYRFRRGQLLRQSRAPLRWMRLRISSLMLGCPPRGRDRPWWVRGRPRSRQRLCFVQCVCVGRCANSPPILILKASEGESRMMLRTKHIKAAAAAVVDCQPFENGFTRPRNLARLSPAACSENDFTWMKTYSVLF
jgi:hypothetical protein